MRSSLCEARGRSFRQISMVSTVEAELKMEVKDDMMADNMTANSKPRAPKVNNIWGK